MTERMIVNRVRKLKELENQHKALEEQIGAVKEEIKAYMNDRGLEEQKAGEHIVRFATIISNRFDSKAFKAVHGGLYEQFTKVTESKRFSVA